MEPKLKRLAVWGGPLDSEELDLPEGGAEIKGSPGFDGIYLDRGDYWQYVDKRFLHMVHEAHRD
jgi:hypothetical protein